MFPSRPSRRRVLALAGGVAAGVGAVDSADARTRTRTRIRPRTRARARASGWVVAPGPEDAYDVLFDGLVVSDGSDGRERGVFAGSVGGDVGETGWLVGIRPDGRVDWRRRYRLLSPIHRLGRLPDGDLVGLGWGPQLARFSTSVPPGEPPAVVWTTSLAPDAHGGFGLAALADAVVAAWEFQGASGTTLRVAGVDPGSGTRRWQRPVGDEAGGSDTELGGLVPAVDGGVAVVTDSGSVREFGADGAAGDSFDLGRRVDEVRRVGEEYLVASGGEGRLALAWYDAAWTRRAERTLYVDADTPFVVTDLAPLPDGPVGVAGYRRTPVPVPTVGVVSPTGGSWYVSYEVPPTGRQTLVEHYAYAVVPLGTQFVAVGAAGAAADRNAWVAALRHPTSDSSTAPPGGVDTTPSDAPTEDRSSPTPRARTAERSPSPVWTTPARTSTPTAFQSTTDTDSPGFGPLAALAGAGLAGLSWLRSRRS